MTCGEFVEQVIEALEGRGIGKNVIPDSGRKVDYGVMGIARTFGCARSKAQKLKSSGILDEALIQHGRKIVIDCEHALSLVKNKKIE